MSDKEGNQVTAVSEKTRNHLATEAAIRELDLTMICLKARDHEEGEGWSAEYTARVRAEYDRFLTLTALYPNKAIVPSKPVDTFWHYHILDTQAYAADCDHALGYFLHHFPYFGMRGPDDAQALGNAYDETLALYQETFGDPPADLWQREGLARCPKCGRRCSQS